MFFKQVRHNASKHRKNSGLFFGSLVVAIIAFYTLLSLDHQDVMRFLKTVESDAVSKLMLLIPMVYMISLFFVFFLVYFAYRYQLEGRKKEFGLYLMFGMKKRTIFAMLMSETLWNSLVSILIGFPIALLLTEGISLTTAKLVGIGIIGHQISFSLSAVLWTIVGFMGVQMIAMLFLSAEFSLKEPLALLKSNSEEKQVALSTQKGWINFAIGILFLLIAYVMGVTMLKSFDFRIVLLILIFGFSGTFLLYRGMGVFIGHQIHRKSQMQSGLYTFTGRQIQENVIYHYNTLAITSLLLLMALSCVSFGIGVASGHGSIATRTVDFSIEGSEKEVQEVLESEEINMMISTYYPMFLSSMHTNTHDFSWKGLNEALSNLPKTALIENMIENLSDRSGPYMISESSYNSLLQAIDKTPIHLGENQMALYTSMRDSSDFVNNLDEALKLGACIEVNHQQYELLPHIYYDNVVADRKITLYCAVIVSDEDYQKLAVEGSVPLCWNVLLNQKLINEKGLMQAIQSMTDNLAGTGLEYESYIGGVGRTLFYTVAASALTLYLGFLFIIIANTVIGLKCLIQQRANKHRYLTLLMLGADVNALCKSASTQISLFFVLAFGVSMISSVFAIISMFTSFLKLPVGTSITQIILFTGIAFILFIVIEFIYIRIVVHANNGEIKSLRVTDRGNAF